MQAHEKRPPFSMAASPGHIPPNLPTGGKEHKGDRDLQQSTLGVRAQDGGGSRNPYVACASNNVS